MTVKNLSSAVNAYRYNMEPAGKKRTAAKKASGKNTDKAEFSGSGRASFADTLRAAAKTAAESSASAERITALRSAVRDGSYSVSAETVADSILGR